MKFLFSILICIVLSFGLQLIGPWWTIAIVGFAVGYFFEQNGFLSFNSGLIAGFLLWFGYSIYLSSQNNDLLSNKMAMLFNFSSPTLLFLVSGIIAGLVLGFAQLSGSLFVKKVN